MLDGMLNIAVFSVAVVFVISFLFKKKVVDLQDKYETEEDTKNREEINRKSHLNKLGIAILLFSIICYSLAVAAVFQSMKISAFTVIIAVLLLLPFITMAVGLFGVLSFIVHLSSQKQID